MPSSSPRAPSTRIHQGLIPFHSAQSSITQPHHNPTSINNPSAKKGIRTLLSASLLDLVGKAVPHETVVGLELLHGLGRVVQKGESSALAATVLGAETEDGNRSLLGLVQRGELVAELILGDIGAVWVEDVTANDPSQ